MKKSLHFLRKVAEDIWAIRERYFESSINYANLFFFQVRALLSIFSSVRLESKYFYTKGTTADLLLDTGVGIHEVTNGCYYKSRLIGVY